MTAGGSWQSTDPATQALSQVLGQAGLPVAHSRVLFLRARGTGGMQEWIKPGWTCVQSFRPQADTLVALGLDVRMEPPVESLFPLVLALPPRQRDEARALLASAVAHLEPGGTVFAAMPNNQGARAAEADLARLAGPVERYSKHKCRVFWARAEADSIDRVQVAQWQQLDAERAILQGRYLSRPGLFAWDHVDPASALLAAHLPADLRGRVADLGAGWGYLATQVLARGPAVRTLDLYEAEGRALAPARHNVQRTLLDLGRSVEVNVHWHDVTRGLPATYHAIVSNPPFHVGRADQPELGRAFIRAAAGALVPGGRLFMVANRHLPYEAVLRAHFTDVHTRADAQGFKVFEAMRGASR